MKARGNDLDQVEAKGSDFLGCAKVRDAYISLFYLLLFMHLYFDFAR